MKAILFVDDHEVLARLSCEILEMQGYRAVSACSGAEALKKFEQDDFGLTAGVNRAIAEGNRCGVVTSATVMANVRAFDEAMGLAKALPGLKTGCHVVLIDGEALSSDIPSLTNGTSLFRSSLKDFA